MIDHNSLRLLHVKALLSYIVDIVNLAYLFHAVFTISLIICTETSQLLQKIISSLNVFLLLSYYLFCNVGLRSVTISTSVFLDFSSIGSLFRFV